ncbi:hypothetical protein GEMRC1_001858 [Eukaryota sp. GEM-RC1]
MSSRYLDNNNYCVPCGAAPCVKVPPHSPNSQDPTMSRFFREGPALRGMVTSPSEGPALQGSSSLEGSALQDSSSVEGSALPDPSLSEGPALQGLTSPEGPILQDSVSAPGSALQNSVSATSPLPETVQITAPPVIITIEDSPSTVISAQTGSRSSTPPTVTTIEDSPPATTSPSFERIRSMFDSKPKAKNTPFPSLNIEETTTPSVTPLVPPGGFTFPERGSPLVRVIPKKSQVGPIPTPKTSKPPVPDINPTRGHRVAKQPVIPTVDPDLEDLVPYDVPDDEESRQPPPVGPADHSQPPPSRPTGQEFQPPSIIPVQGFIPVRSSKTGSSELFQALPGPYQQGLTDEELKLADRRMFQVGRQQAYDFLYGRRTVIETPDLRNRFPRPALAAIRVIRHMFNDEVPPLEGTFTILDDQRKPHSILMDPSEPESLIPIRKCWEIVQDVRTAHLFTKNGTLQSKPVTSLSSKESERSTTAIDEVVIQPTALKHRARVEHEAELARRAQSNPIPKMKEVS